MNDTRPRCDYEGSRYQDEFWTPDRTYEDRVERIALQRLLPPRGRRLIEIGAGAGRLASLYEGYEEVYLLDYARSQLEQAAHRLGHDPRIHYVQGDIYNLPFASGFFDTVVTVRVLHHVVDLGAAFEEIARILAPGGIYITEYANKRNLKAILRWLLRRARPGENPFSLDPYEFVPLNLDYHPAMVDWELRIAGFAHHGELSASFFRVPLLKRVVPTNLLVALDARLQRPLAPLRLTPSIFVRTKLIRQQRATDEMARWRCPTCHSLHMEETKEGLACHDCSRFYPKESGVYVLRADLIEGAASRS